ncbi:MAG TPA: hypothetical protein VI072_22350 [Polyangiaceae bacterium]
MLRDLVGRLRPSLLLSPLARTVRAERLTYLSEQKLLRLEQELGRVVLRTA